MKPYTQSTLCLAQKTQEISAATDVIVVIAIWKWSLSPYVSSRACHKGSSGLSLTKWWRGQNASPKRPSLASVLFPHWESVRLCLDFFFFLILWNLSNVFQAGGRETSRLLFNACRTCALVYECMSVRVCVWVCFCEIRSWSVAIQESRRVHFILDKAEM